MGKHKISNSLIEKLFKKWKRILKIKKKVLWTDNAKTFKEASSNKKSIKFICSVWGASFLSTPPLIFINKTRHKTKEGLEHTIIHELSHVKHTKFNEMKVRKFVKKFFD